MTLKNRILNLLKLFFSIFNYEIEIKKIILHLWVFTSHTKKHF